jgi:fumarate hydratase subunit alpha
MRTIAFEDVSDAVERLCIDCAYELPSDVIGALEAAMQREHNPRAKEILRQLLENARIAREDRIPLCQDTGLAVVFAELGAEATIAPAKDRPDATLIDAIQAGVAAGYDKGLLRKSVVAEPLKDRKNTGTNTPAIVHLSIAPGDRLTISIMAKGGGCENKSAFKVFKPTQNRDEVIDWVVDVVARAGADACPPFVVGVGLGGDFEVSCLLAKKALLRDIGRSHNEPFYAEMERTLLAKINALGVGPQGLGGGTTALAVQIETAPCHIASLPAAVNIECHSHRHKSVIL